VNRRTRRIYANELLLRALRNRLLLSGWILLAVWGNSHGGSGGHVIGNGRFLPLRLSSRPCGPVFQRAPSSGYLAWGDQSAKLAPGSSLCSGLRSSPRRSAGVMPPMRPGLVWAVVVVCLELARAEPGPAAGRSADRSAESNLAPVPRIRQAQCLAGPLQPLRAGVGAQQSCGSPRDG
jgi:hypothetical protein